MPLIFLLTILLILWIRYAGKKVDQQSSQSSEEFWQREQEANFARTTDISTLPYIKIPAELLQLSAEVIKTLSPDSPEGEEVLSLTQELNELADASILNLTGMSNTELKLRYGFANLETLIQCDENFTRLCRVLNRLGCLLKEFGLEAEAVHLLSYAVECGSDVQETYLTLAQLYQQEGNQNALSNLLESVSRFDGLRRSTLEAALMAYHTPE